VGGIFAERNGKPGNLICDNTLFQFCTIIPVAVNFMLVLFYGKVIYLL
jgi:ligand-binding sensor protein